VKTVYNAINNKKKNFGFWFDAMRRAKSLAKKRAYNYAEGALAAAGLLVNFKEGAMTRRKRTRKEPASFAITVNTRVRVRVGMPNVIIVFVRADVYEQGHQIFIRGKLYHMPQMWACPLYVGMPITRGHAHYTWACPLYVGMPNKWACP
jgi:hypothetical protein